LFRETSPGPLKHALSLLGFMSGRLRLPLVPPGESVQAEIAALLALLLRDHGEYIIGKDAILKRNIGNAAMA
jgi:dihydrodipicolinate synthase/N-acetylneuraminate lyase